MVEEEISVTGETCVILTSYFLTNDHRLSKTTVSCHYSKRNTLIHYLFTYKLEDSFKPWKESAKDSERLFTCSHEREIMSAPDSWDQRLDPRVPPGQSGDLNARFGRMNVNANTFVPNVQAHSFVPGSAGGSSGYGPPYGSYPMHGEHLHTACNVCPLATNELFGWACTY